MKEHEAVGDLLLEGGMVEQREKISTENDEIYLFYQRTLKSFL